MEKEIITCLSCDDSIGAIPQDWCIGKVKYAFTRKKDKAYEEDPVVLSLARAGVKIRDISNNEGQLASSYDGYNPVSPGDLLLNPMDLYSGANCSISKVKGVISPAYFNLRARNGYDPRYYDYFFKTQYWSMALFAKGRGVSFNNRWTLNYETLNNILIPMPSYEEQKKIADYLDDIIGKTDTVIANETRSIEDYKKWKQAIIYETVINGLEEGKGKKNSGVDWIGEIPEDWNVTKIGRMCFVTKLAGFEYTSSMADNILAEGEVPIVRAQNIKMGRFIDNISEFISMDLSVKLSRCALDQKCLLITFIGAGIGEVTIFDKAARYHLAPNVAKIVINEEMKRYISEEYLLYFLMSPAGQEEVNRIKKATAQPSLSMETIRGMRIVVPKSLGEQHKIVSYLNERCKKIDGILEEKYKLIDNLETFRRSIIFDVVTGKRRVV